MACLEMSPMHETLKVGVTFATDRGISTEKSMSKTIHKHFLYSRSTDAL